MTKHWDVSFQEKWGIKLEKPRRDVVIKGIEDKLRRLGSREKTQYTVHNVLEICGYGYLKGKYSNSELTESSYMNLTSVINETGSIE